MTILEAQNLACPIDGVRLERQEKQLVCENGHAFDIARQGYINLLPVQQKRSKQPGDSKEMVLARRKFLNTGVYDSIAKTLADLIDAQITDNQHTCLMDAGCGEGYYIDFVFNYLKEKNDHHDFSFIGLDISKTAIIESAKRNKQITWLVGTNREPPISYNSVDIILCVFGFQHFEGFNKILNPNGKIILVEPGPDHLKELRDIIYADVKKTEPPDLSHLEKQGLTIMDRQKLYFKTGEINNEQINNLFLMTPHFYKATKEGRETAISLKKLDLTVDVVLRVLKKMG